MTWLQFISEMVGHLAWPIVVLVIVFAVRKHLGSLVERVLELSFGGATVKFDKLLSKGAEIIAELPSTELSELEDRRLDKSLSRMQEIRSRPDVGHMLATYTTIELLIRQIGEAVGVHGPISEIVRYLWQKDLIPAGFPKLYETLREGRNVVAHGQTNLSQHEIEEYVRQAQYLQVTLLILLKQIRSGERKVPPA